MFKFFALLPGVCFSLQLRNRAIDQYGCSTTNPTGPCIQPVQIEPPQRLAPATIITQTDDTGFLTASTLPGDDGSSGDPGEVALESSNPAAKYMITAPELAETPSAPPLIVCQTPEECTTSTTVAPGN